MHTNQIARIRQIAETAVQSGRVANVTVDQLTDHMVAVEEVAQMMRVQLDPMKFALGVSRDELVAAAESKIKTAKRSAGARALSKKYGKEAAERIIAEKTGKHINLR